MSIWVLVVYALATARLTGLVTADDITDPARRAILRHLPDHAPGPFLAALLTCGWCAGVWVGFMVAPVAVWAPTAPWALWPAAALAMAQFAGMTAHINRPDPEPAEPAAPPAGDPWSAFTGALNPDGT